METRDARKTQKGGVKRKWMLLILLLCLFLPTPTLSESAIEDNTRLIEANPNDAGAYYDRGRAYYDQKNYKEPFCQGGIMSKPGLFTGTASLQTKHNPPFSAPRNATYHIRAYRLPVPTSQARV